MATVLLDFCHVQFSQVLPRSLSAEQPQAEPRQDFQYAHQNIEEPTNSCHFFFEGRSNFHSNLFFSVF